MRSSDVFFFWIHRNLVSLLNPDVSGMCGFWNIHRKYQHLGPFRCIVTQVSVGDTSGLRFQCPSRCTKVQYQVKNTSGWANIGLFRCIASNRQISPKQNTSEFSNFIQSRCISINFPRFYSLSLTVYPRASQPQLISREYTRSPSRYIPAQAGKT